MVLHSESGLRIPSGDIGPTLLLRGVVRSLGGPG